MKKCISCDIYVDGDRKTCPICQNALNGEASPYNWPLPENFKKHAMLYKIQLFIVLTVIVIALALDFLLDLNPGTHYGLTIAGWGIMAELMIKSFIKKHLFPAKIVSYSAVVLSVLLALTSYYYHFFNPIFYLVIPIIIGGTIIANFVFCLIDKKGNSLVYLLCTILIGILPYIAIYLGHKDMVLPWTICLIVSVIAFIGIVVFKGKNVRIELAKRFNF